MFQAAIGHSHDVDSLEAAREVIEQCKAKLQGRAPQAGILFSAMDFDHEAILETINEAFEGIELIGCTTDGEVSSLLEFQEDSLTLLVLASERIEIKAGLGRNLSADLAAATAQATQEAKAKCTKEPRLCIITPESMTVSSSNVLEHLSHELGETFPIFGGIAADQWQFKKTYQFYGKERLSDALPLLLFAGPIQFSHGVGSGWSPIGKQGTVTSVSGNVVHRIDDQSAIEFYKYYLGDHITPSGEYPLAVFDPAEEHFYLRAPLAYDEESGSITFAGDLPEQATVQLTATQRDKILHASQTSMQDALSHYSGEPTLAIIISCAARKQLLGTRTNEEYKLFREHAADLDVFGFYAYGEIAPLQANKPTRFHNETLITLLLGDASH